MTWLGHRAVRFGRAAGTGVPMVALAAALWGTDGVLRLPLAQELAASTLVLAEHVILVLLTLPLLPRALRAARGLGWRGWLAVVVIGVGSSALATLLFTRAFTYGDAVTPLLLQQLQPLIALAAAWVLLRERPRPLFAVFAVTGLAGAWLVAFPEPGEVHVSRAVPALLAVAAAALWALGTVLGRYLSTRLRFEQVLTLRVAGGLVGGGLAVALTASPAVPPAGSFTGVLLLALVPGLLSLALYYRGLQDTPASIATLAELAFPLTSAVLGYLVLGQQLTVSQWLGVALLCGTVVVLSASRSRRSVRVPAAPALDTVGDAREQAP